MKKECLNCRWFKLNDIHVGLCRKVKGKGAPRPVVKGKECCGGWQDAGPQYHVRVGWIKNQKGKIKSLE
jgi:hypothetical protein